jgi:hypothetical protein
MKGLEDLLHGPTLKPVGYISPSRTNVLAACFLQVAFSADTQFREYVFVGPRARLGTASHLFLEKILRGQLDQVILSEWDTALSELWYEILVQEEKKVQASEIERHFGSAVRWPGYHMLRARSIHLGREILERRRHSARGTVEIQTEVIYQAFNGKLRGRADVVLTRAGVTEIEDYKTGDLYDRTEDGEEPVLKAQYRRQLLLYASMHHDVTACWPTKAHLIPLTGGRVSITIDPIEAENETLAAINLLDRYNSQIATVKNSEELADPSSSTCRYCNYRLFCNPFWSAVSPDWGWAPAAAIEAEALQVQRNSIPEGWVVEADVSRGTVFGQNCKILVDRDIAVDGGERFRCVDLHHQQSSGLFAFKTTPYTQIQLIPSLTV